MKSRHMFAVFAVCAAFVVPGAATPLATLPTVPALPGHASLGLSAANATLAVAQMFRDHPLGDALQAFSAAVVPLPAPASTNVTQALARLAQGAGAVPGTTNPYARLSVAQQAALTRLIDGVRESARTLDLAFANLTAGDRVFLRDHILNVDSPGSASQERQEAAQRVAKLEPLVNVPLLRGSGIILVRAADEAKTILAPNVTATTAPTTTDPSRLPGVGTVTKVLAPPTVINPVPAPPPSSPTPCRMKTNGDSTVDATGMVEVGMQGSNNYTEERVLIVDLGGDDCYQNHPASIGPGTRNRLPVSLVFDVDGNDIYLTDRAVGGLGNSMTTTWASGVGIVGTGMLVDLAGNDRHVSTLTQVFCDWWSYTYDFAQGVGVLGIGGLIDEGGNDRYYANVTIEFSTGCIIRATEPWQTYNPGLVYPMVAAQGVGAHQGFGFLADTKGNDLYVARSIANNFMDQFARARAQAAASGGAALLLDVGGSDRYFANVTARADGVYAKLAEVDVHAQGTTHHEGPALANFALSPFEAAIVQGPVIPPIVPPYTPCQTLVVSPCDLMPVALMLDLGGQDLYQIHALADAPEAYCHEVYAKASGQGSSDLESDPIWWTRRDETPFASAGLVDLASNAVDSFVIDSKANGPCAEAATRGQGAATASENPADAHPVGVLYRVGCDMKTATAVTVVVDGSTAVEQRNVPCGASYAARSEALGGGYVAGSVGAFAAKATTVVQGAAYSGDQYATTYAIGVHVDARGNDTLLATADADSSSGDVLPVVMAQGAAGGSAIGVYMNTEGTDSYFARSRSNGAATPDYVIAQADARRWAVGPVLAPAALFVDLQGLDSYTEPCAMNNAVWGFVAGQLCGAADGTSLGIDQG